MATGTMIPSHQHQLRKKRIPMSNIAFTCRDPNGKLWRVSKQQSDLMTNLANGFVLLTWINSKKRRSFRLVNPMTRQAVDTGLQISQSGNSLLNREVIKLTVPHVTTGYVDRQDGVEYHIGVLNEAGWGLLQE